MGGGGGGHYFPRGGGGGGQLFSRGGGDRGGTLIFSSYVGSGPSIYCSPPKKNPKFQAPQKNI